MILRVDLTSPTPPYEQIRSQLAGLAGAGRLAPGTRLPPVRQLAADLGVAPGTVARAYRELEEAGLLVTRGRRGTFAAGTATAPDGESEPARLAQTRLARAAAEFADAALALGASQDSALAAAREAFAVRKSAAATPATAARRPESDRPAGH